ncbi:uncharacterized protein SAPINGB_P002685 [Magnusiomyces paraingens]|uniref:ATP-dependent DNA helicase n=1 Tax=Magnusiomyces paraingens TaxID=2606893 RepID=A0A5E8BFG4_9ASCO|nr:uncharacterized protein SAPINGB_P002685 [Saprochaete ingens]VVT50269.1 unnamed protein product [Saprochaete ingens]
MQPVDGSYLHSVLKSVFGKSAFRSCQEDIIRAALEGYDLLVLLPTGHGKSLTYQLPAVATKSPFGVTIVVSPLIALMKSQLDGLLGNEKIHAAALHGQLSTADRQRVLMDLTSSAPQTRLLYVSPELCATPAFRKMLTKMAVRGAVARFVIDEAHCCVEWGLDFRPSYKELRYMREEFPSVPITALTATASETVQRGIVEMLGLDTPRLKKFTTSVNRPNLHYEVKYFTTHNYERDIIPNLVKFLTEYKARRESVEASLQNQEGSTDAAALAWLRRRKSSGAGIIYCRKKSTVELVAQALQSAGFGANAYHAGLSQEHRDNVLSEWLANTPGFEVVVATVAFGMGIDKEDVRFVIHADLPGSVESYYQASGRAGRDGKGARCILYYSREDRDRVLALNRGKGVGGGDEEEVVRKRYSNTQEEPSSIAVGLRWLVQYCENTNSCRHLYLCGYFEKEVPQTPSAEWCHYACDYCKDARAVSNRSKVLAEESMDYYQFYY